MRLLAVASRTHLVLLAAVLSAASCTAILGISGDFKQGAGGSTSASSGGGMPSTSSSMGGTTTQGTGGSGASSTGGAGGSAGASSSCPHGDPMCTSCIEMNCAPELNGSGGGGGANTGCLNDPTCASWYECSKSCCDDDCATSCDVDFQAPSFYQPVYACACQHCATECAAFDPCVTHPCKLSSTFASNPGNVYCPFSGVDGGMNLFCNSMSQHCCEPGAGTATCEGNGMTCAAGDRDWQCDEQSDCSQGICCVVATSDVTFPDTKQCLTSANNQVVGSHCQSQCNAAQHGLKVCSADSDCAAPKTCWQLTSHGMTLGVCH